MASASKKHSNSEREKSEEASLSPKVSKRVAQYIYCPEPAERPRTRRAVKELVELYGLGHGDVVNFGDYRDGWSRVVKLVKEGEAMSDSDLCWSDDEQENDGKNDEEEEEKEADGKDDGKVEEEAVKDIADNKESLGESDSKNDYPLYKLAYNCGHDAYLGIPKEVLADIDDAITFYKDIIADAPSLDLLISSRDKFVVDRLGQVPNDWEFMVVYNWGALEDFLIKVPGHDWERFDPDTITREKIDARYFSRPLMMINVSYTINNVNDKSKYELDISCIPSTWIMTKISRGIKSFEINLSGPLSDGEEVQNTIANVLKGIEYDLKVNIEG